VGYADDGETPNTQLILHDYAHAPLLFEVRGLPATAQAHAAGTAGSLGGAEAAAALAGTMDKYRGVSIGVIVDCEGGSVVVADYFTARAFDRAGQLLREFKGVDRHMQNFVDVVHSRRTEELYGDVADGHVSSALCHLGNLSHQLGRATPSSEIEAQIKSSTVLVDAWQRMVEHLARNQVDLARTPLALGLPLAIDAGTERFVGAGAERANPLLRRNYRAPFVVPEMA
jgi:hypothetical protein